MQALTTSRLAKDRNLRFLLAEGFLALIFFTSCSAYGASTFLLAFLKKLGATPIHIGLLAAIPSFGFLIQIASSYHLERGASKKSICFWGNFLSRSSWFLVVLVPFLFLPSTNLVVPLILSCVLLSTLLGAYGTNGYQSWNVDLISREVRGRFAAIKNLVCQVTAVTVLLISGKLLSQHPSQNTYLALFAVGTLFGIFSTMPFLLLPDGARVKGSNLGLLEVVKKPFGNPNFRRFLTSIGLFTFGNTLMGAFGANYLLDEFHVSMFFLSVMDSLSIVMQLTLAFFWGWFSDRYGHRLALLIGFWGVVLTPLGWILSTSANYRFVIPLLYASAALFWSGISLAQYNLTLELVPASANAKYFAAAALVGGIAGTAGSLLGGFFMENAPKMGLMSSPARAYFAICFATMAFRLLSAIALLRVKEPVARPMPAFFNLFARINPSTAKG